MTKTPFLTAIAAIALIGAACSTSSTASAQGAQQARAANACNAAGLDPSEEPYSECIRSLQQPTFAQYRGDTNSMQAQRACGAMGYKGGDYQACVGNLDQTLFDAQNINAR
jgi:hypothetical protein